MDDPRLPACYFCSELRHFALSLLASCWGRLLLLLLSASLPLSME